MRKLALFLLPLLIVGCEQTFDNIIDYHQDKFQVTFVGPTDSVAYRINDSLRTVFISFSQGSVVENVFCDILASDGSKLNTSQFQLFDDDGDNRFSNEFPFSTYYPNGRYNIKFYVPNMEGNILVAVSEFEYYNGQDYVAPVLSNLMIPDVISKGTEFTFSVEVSDSNGLNDVLRVYYELYRPNGSQVANSDGVTKFPLFDNGEAGTGDLTAGDGIYTVKLTFPQEVESGTWRFEFTAEDRSGLTSNVLIHFMEVN